MRRMIAFVPGIAVLAAAALAGAEAPALLAQSVNWPGVETVWQHGTMFYTSAPNAEGLAHAKTQGVTTVINLMLEDEDPAPFWPKEHGEKHWFQYALEQWFPELQRFDEANEAKKLGLRYVSIPISVSEPNVDAVQRYLNTVDEAQARQMMVHCDAAGRALAMWAIYLGTSGGLSPDAALAQAKQAGLDHAGLESFVLAYLQNKHKAA